MLHEQVVNIGMGQTILKSAELFPSSLHSDLKGSCNLC